VYKDKLLELTRRRKTARIFSKRKVSIKEVLYCLNVAIQAPSGANAQPWQFIIIDDIQILKHIRADCERQEKKFHENVKKDFKEWLKAKGITYRKPFLTEAPLLIVIFSDQTMPYATESVWLMIGYLLLSLEEVGFSTLTYTPSFSRKVGKMLNAQKNYKLEAILPIGYSTDTKPKEERKPLGSLVYYNVWGNNLKHGYGS
jgi:nitroreductase